MRSRDVRNFNMLLNMSDPTPTGAISGSQANCGTFRVMLKDELHSIQPVIRVTVENAVRKLLPNTICSKEDVESAVKSLRVMQM